MRKQSPKPQPTKKIKEPVAPIKDSYIHYNRITTYTEFVDYCLRKLGAPMVDINITPEQILDRISDALQFYLEYDLESVSECWFLHSITDEEVANGYLMLPLDVLDVMEVYSCGKNYTIAEPKTDDKHPFGYSKELEHRPVGNGIMTMSDGSVTTSNLYGNVSFGSDEFMTNYTYQWWQGYWNYGYSMFGQTPLFYYEISMQYISALKQTFNARVEFLYRRRQRKLWMYSEKLFPKRLICLYGTKILDPETEDCIWESDFLKNYATCLIGLQWATNLSKYTSIPLSGGLTIDASQMLQKYTDEKTQLEEQHKLQFREPIMPFVG